MGYLSNGPLFSMVQGEEPNARRFESSIMTCQKITIKTKEIRASAIQNKSKKLSPLTSQRRNARITFGPEHTPNL